MKERKSHVWDRDPLDYYVEPVWCSRRLFQVERFTGNIHDPCAGSGRIVIEAMAAGYHSTGCDILPRRPGIEPADFMKTQHDYANIVSNPPFGICEPGKGRPVGLVELAIERTNGKCAMLLPTIWLQGDKRSRWMETTPLYRVYFLTPRPSMPPGAALEAGEKPGGGRVDFAWFVWWKSYSGPPQLSWLRRDEKRLTQAEAA